jgi:hypothetical protein
VIVDVRLNVTLPGDPPPAVVAAIRGVLQSGVLRHYVDASGRVTWGLPLPLDQSIRIRNGDVLDPATIAALVAAYKHMTAPPFFS